MARGGPETCWQQPKVAAKLGIEFQNGGREELGSFLILLDDLDLAMWQDLVL